MFNKISKYFLLFRSCVLASREHTCIQDSNIHYPDVTYKSKTELCKDLLDPKAVSEMIFCGKKVLFFVNVQ